MKQQPLSDSAYLGPDEWMLSELPPWDDDLDDLLDDLLAEADLGLALTAEEEAEWLECLQEVLAEEEAALRRARGTAAPGGRRSEKTGTRR